MTEGARRVPTGIGVPRWLMAHPNRCKQGSSYIGVERCAKLARVAVAIWSDRALSVRILEQNQIGNV